jgi:type VI secretion system protein ImpI
MTQTPLLLRIINMTSLPDGGPLEVTVAPGGMLEAGRDSGLDWCLPDTARFISSRHFEIRSEQGGWMLYDLSTNGTFVNGATTRVKSPCPLENGDRLQVGQYTIEVICQGVAAAQPILPAPQPAQDRPFARGLPGGRDPWSVQSAPVAEAPIPQNRLSPTWEKPADPAPVATSADIWSMPAANAPVLSPAPVPPPIALLDPTVAPNTPPGPAPAPWPPAPAPESFTAPPVFAPPPPSAPLQQPFAPSRPDPGNQALLEQIEAAAGLAHGTLSRGDPQATAREIGETLRALTEELSGLLQARAVARRSVRSAQVTMIGREDNNPLKFMPTPDQALGVMFGPPRPGFQRGAAAVRAGFADIKTHQYATHAALQPALAQLLDDLSPEAIEKRLEGVRLNRKARAWELFVERWDAKTHAHDNGMLDVFLALFADAYDREGGRKG